MAALEVSYGAIINIYLSALHEKGYWLKIQYCKPRKNNVHYI